MNAYIRLSPVLALALGLAACGGEPASHSVHETVPVGPGSMGPNLASGANGEVVLSWMEKDGEGHALRFSQLEADGWTAARTISRGDNWFVNWADFPSVVPLSDSLWAAHWLQSQPAGGYAYDVLLSISEDSGDTWSEPFMPHTDGTPTEHGFVSLFPDSNGVGAVWLDGRKMINEYDEDDVTASGMTLRAGTFGADQLPIRESLVDDLICDCCQTDVALTPEGPVAVYRNRTTKEIRDIYVSRREFGEWQAGTPVAADNWEIPACPVNGPIVRSNGDQLAVAWFTAANQIPMVKAAWSNDGGRTFSAPVVLNEELPLGHVGAVMLDSGDLVVSWHRRAGNGGAKLMMRRAAADGRTSEVFEYGAADNVFSFSVPQLARFGDDIVVAWTESVDEQYSVHTGTLSLESLPPLVDPLTSAN